MNKRLKLMAVILAEIVAVALITIFVPFPNNTCLCIISGAVAGYIAANIVD